MIPEKKRQAHSSKCAAQGLIPQMSHYSYFDTQMYITTHTSDTTYTITPTIQIFTIYAGIFIWSTFLSDFYATNTV